MKIIFLIMLISGLFFSAFSQAQKIPLVSDSTFFYADSISETITINKNEWLSQIWLDADRSLTVTPQFYDASKQKWSGVNDGGSALVYTTADSSLNWVIPLEPKMFYSNKIIRFIIAWDPADTLSMRYDKRPY